VTVRTYASPVAFKQALEQRLRTGTGSSTELARKRQLLVFDRFLARLVAVLGDTAMLKGGLVLEFRLARARTTKDLDLRVTGSPDNVLAKLQEAARRDLGDFMTFEVGPDEDHPEIRNEGMQYAGLRFRAECRLAGKIYGPSAATGVSTGFCWGLPSLKHRQAILRPNRRRPLFLLRHVGGTADGAADRP
jgi:hypothetical protein